MLLNFFFLSESIRFNVSFVYYKIESPCWKSKVTRSRCCCGAQRRPRRICISTAMEPSMAFWESNGFWYQSISRLAVYIGIGIGNFMPHTFLPYVRPTPNEKTEDAQYGVALEHVTLKMEISSFKASIRSFCPCQAARPYCSIYQRCA